MALGGMGFGLGAAGTVGQLWLGDAGAVEGVPTGVPPSGPGATLTPALTELQEPPSPPA